MITLEIIDNLNIRQIAFTLEDMSPLMRDWKNAREDIFNQQFDNELNPENQPLRSLSAKYLEWKRQNYPGRKKRELTGKTRQSHRFVINRNSIQEEIFGNAEYLQGYLELPLFPEDWTNPTEQILINLAEVFLSKNI